MLLSIIIPAHNEERRIGATVAALHEAAHSAGLRHRRDTGLAGEAPAARSLDASDLANVTTSSSRCYEIIVAADSCNDATPELARSHDALVVEVDHRQISRTRNAGARAARGLWLLFVDADTIVPATALHDALVALESGAVGGGAPITFDGPVPLWGTLLLPIATLVMRLARWTGGCFFFCRAEALRSVGGWDESLFASEEIALAQALKKQAGRRAFRIIPSRVITSSRKLRAYSGWEILRRVIPVALLGRKALESRDRLDIWYQRRDEPPSEA